MIISRHIELCILKAHDTSAYLAKILENPFHRQLILLAFHQSIDEDLLILRGQVCGRRGWRMPLGVGCMLQCADRTVVLSEVLSYYRRRNLYYW